LHMTRLPALLLLATLSWNAQVSAQGHAADNQSLWQRFQQPPDDAKPMMRWWWFGPAVSTDELDREIGAMKAGGFGGFEVQPVYPMSVDDPASGVVNMEYLSDEFLAALRHVATTAQKSGMRMDVTLGSGWPFGGPSVPITQASAELRKVTLSIPAGASELHLPEMEPGERPIALFVDTTRVPLPDGAVVKLTATAGERVGYLFIAGRTGQLVKRAAVGAEGFVIDHMSKDAVSGYLENVGDRLLSAFRGATPPYAIFSDSLEAYGSSWTDDLPQEFRRRRGYDLLDHLPALFSKDSAGAGVRFDWARTLSELVNERYLQPIAAWARTNGTRFRAQVYGLPPPTLSSNSLVDLPEGEGADWRQFNSTRWATSAAHIYGARVASAETWTWLHSPAWAASPLDMKVEADRHFLQGVNQIVGHGWPYSPASAPEPGWAFYAAAALNDHNPWYPAMPAVSQYLQRMSMILREGEPGAEVAIYLPSEDVYPEMQPEHASLNDAMRARLEPNIVGQVLDAGHSFDFIDAPAILARKLKSRLLILPGLSRIDPAAYREIATWVANGGIVIATGAPPNSGGGLLEAKAATEEVRRLSQQLFESNATGKAFVVQPPALTASLQRVLKPDVEFAAPDPALGFVHRRLTHGHVYFVANTSPRPIVTSARFTADNGAGEWWDAISGAKSVAGTGDIAIRLAPYETRLLVFLNDARPGTPPREPTLTPLLALSSAWRTYINGQPRKVPQPGESWTEDPALRSFSGVVSYRRAVRIARSDLDGDARVYVDFGSDSPLPESAPNRPRAALDAPVRDAVQIKVNGVDAGVVWTPPWRIDITQFLKPGSNQLELIVMNSALNARAGRQAPDRRLLTKRYGERFLEQDLDKVQPTPSGLLRKVTLVRTSS
jgi:hypothetical protein